MANPKKKLGLPTFYDGYITGNVDAAISFMAIDKSIVADLLPDELTFAEQDLTSKDQHPIYWSFNFLQTNVSTALPSFFLNYNEFAFIIPYLKFKGKTNVEGDIFAYPIKLYLNSFWAMLGGRLFWSFDKVLSQMTIDDEIALKQGENFVIKTFWPFNRKERLSAIFENDGDQITVKDTPNFKRLIKVLDQSFVTCGIFGFFVSRYTLTIKDDLKIQPLRGIIHTTDFLPGFSRKSYEMNSINKSILGTAQFKVEWKLRSEHRVDFFK